MDSTIRDPHTQAILDIGMDALSEKLDSIELETFLLYIKTPGFDYTKWRENLWEDLTPEELLEQCKKIDEEYVVPDRVKII
jgi:hypothetical protein